MIWYDKDVTYILSPAQYCNVTAALEYELRQTELKKI